MVRYNTHYEVMLRIAKKYFPTNQMALEAAVQNAWIKIVKHFHIEEFAPEFLSTEPVETSRKFQKSMQSLCNNPTKWAKQKQNPSWKKAVKMAAAILLICILSIGMLTLISPKAYAAVVNWITEWYETHISYLFTGESEEVVLHNYEITYFPQGYNPHGQFLIQPDKISNTTAITYSGPRQQELYFEYFPKEKILQKLHISI